MDHLTQAQREALAALLQAERTALSARIGGEAEAAAHDGRLGDVQDDAASEARRRQAFDRRERDEARVIEVDAALRRMQDGTYGICEETGEPIPYGRLRAEPTTRYTVEALEMLEEERARERVQRHDDDTKAY